LRRSLSSSCCPTTSWAMSSQSMSFKLSNLCDGPG
jgi:hypothetical protein